MSKHKKAFALLLLLICTVQCHTRSYKDSATLSTTEKSTPPSPNIEDYLDEPLNEIIPVSVKRLQDMPAILRYIRPPSLNILLDPQKNKYFLPERFLFNDAQFKKWRTNSYLNQHPVYDLDHRILYTSRWDDWYRAKWEDVYIALLKNLQKISLDGSYFFVGGSGYTLHIICHALFKGTTVEKRFSHLLVSSEFQRYPDKLLKFFNKIRIQNVKTPYILIDSLNPDKNSEEHSLLTLSVTLRRFLKTLLRLTEPAAIQQVIAAGSLEQMQDEPIHRPYSALDLETYFQHINKLKSINQSYFYLELGSDFWMEFLRPIYKIPRWSALNVLLLGVRNNNNKYMDLDKSFLPISDDAFEFEKNLNTSAESDSSQREVGLGILHKENFIKLHLYVYRHASVWAEGHKDEILKIAEQMDTAQP